MGRQRWKLTSIHERYLDNPFVIATDLTNEISAEQLNNLRRTWGSGNEATDCQLAPTTVACKILAIDPDIPIVIECLSFANPMARLRNDPITLDVPNRLVYSFHYDSWQLWLRNSSCSERKSDIESKAVFVPEWTLTSRLTEIATAADELDGRLDETAPKRDQAEDKLLRRSKAEAAIA